VGVPTRRGDNKRWHDHLDADTAYHRARAHLTGAQRAALDPLVAALLTPDIGPCPPEIYGEHGDHRLYTPAVISATLALSVDLAQLSEALALVDRSDLPPVSGVGAVEAVLWEWLDVLRRVRRQGPGHALLIWVWR